MPEAVSRIVLPTQRTDRSATFQSARKFVRQIENGRSRLPLAVWTDSANPTAGTLRRSRAPPFDRLSRLAKGRPAGGDSGPKSGRDDPRQSSGRPARRGLAVWRLRPVAAARLARRRSRTPRRPHRAATRSGSVQHARDEGDLRETGAYSRGGLGSKAASQPDVRDSAEDAMISRSLVPRSTFPCDIPPTEPDSGSRLNRISWPPTGEKIPVTAGSTSCDTAENYVREATTCRYFRGFPPVQIRPCWYAMENSGRRASPRAITFRLLEGSG